MQQHEAAKRGSTHPFEFLLSQLFPVSIRGIHHFATLRGLHGAGGGSGLPRCGCKSPSPPEFGYLHGPEASEPKSESLETSVEALTQRNTPPATAGDGSQDFWIGANFLAFAEA